MPWFSGGHRHFAQPQWRGEAAEGRALLVHAEQGFGDTLQFCRYVPLAAARVCASSCKCQSHCPGCCAIFPASIDY
jgi:hypothetical protein